MSSPFKTFKEFSEVDGPIYSFANSPGIIGLFIVVSAAIFLYFLYASFATHKGKTTAKNPVVLSLLIATSAFSLTNTVYANWQKSDRTPSAAKQSIKRATASPLAQVIGIFGAAIAYPAAKSDRVKKRSRRR